MARAPQYCWCGYLVKLLKSRAKRTRIGCSRQGLGDGERPPGHPRGGGDYRRLEGMEKSRPS